MKKIPTLIIFALTLLLLLTSCSEASDEELNAVYRINVDNTEFIVDTNAQTITDSENEYVYTKKGDTVTIYYPDGSTYWWTFTDLGGHGGWSDDYVETKYISGDTLITALEHRFAVKEEQDNEDKIYNPFGLILIAVGIFGIAKPEKAWYISRGWQFKNAEPSDEALVAERFTGGIAILIGIILFFA